MKKAFFTLALALAPIFALAQAQDSIPDIQKQLEEVTVKGRHTLSKMKGNALVFKPDVLRERYAPASAYDLLAKIPNVSDNGASLSLLGANSLMLVIDGKTVAMPQEQVCQQLRTLTADKVKEVEIHYNAPARYHFNGAVINVVTTLGTASETSVFLDASLRQTRKTSTDDRASLLWSNQKIVSFTSAGYVRTNRWSSTDYELFPDASFSNPYRTRHSESRVYGDKFRVSEDLTFNLSPESRLTFDYYGLFDHDNAETNTAIRQTAAQPMKALSREHTKETLHTAGLQADLRHGWTIGARYKSYVSPFNQRYAAAEENTPLVLPAAYLQESRQNVDNARASIDKVFQFNPMTSLSVGLSHQFNRSTTEITADEILTRNRQTENIEALYAQGSFMLFHRLSATLGLRGEYIHSTRRDLVSGQRSTLWNEFALFPTVTLGMLVARDKFLQFELNSQKHYPSFWAVSPETTVIDERTIETGNPDLKPSRIYDASLMFILRQKWFFILGCTYTPDYFANIPHQDAATGLTVYRYENYDYSLFNSFTIMHPLSFGRYNGRISAHVLRMQDKMSDFHGTSFDNAEWVWAASLNNTYRLPLGRKLGDLFLEANFRYQAPAIQGIYRLSDTFALDADIRWNPTKRISITASVDNILRRATPHQMKVTTPGQESILHAYNTRTALLRLTINLGRQKESRPDTGVDTSRYGRKR